jgi:hydroxymethylpyrimidine/phosphomethylpyrimidine kinase
VKGRVLIIAGSDSGGGAGIQADIKAVTALGGFAMTAITALTAQNTLGVHDIHGVSEDFITKQIDVVLGDLGADAIKTGMLHSPSVIQTVVSALESCAAPIVVDPVMRAKGGAALLQPEAQAALVDLLLPRATLLTPNVPEAEALTGLSISSVADLRTVGERLLAMGPKAVLMKGGHLDGAAMTDVLVTEDGATVIGLGRERLDTPHTHGTGCTLASATAVGLAQSMTMQRSVERAVAYVDRAIRLAPGYGQGHGPINHAHPLERAEPEDDWFEGDDDHD